MTLEQLEEVIQQTRRDYEQATQKLSEFKEGTSEAPQGLEAPDKRKDAADECREVDVELDMEEGSEPALINDKPSEQNHLYPPPFKLKKPS
ncbi:UNVERIFIED_CONTAM: hypothetical protein K2H54_000328 [Gekko kuhli]